MFARPDTLWIRPETAWCTCLALVVARFLALPVAFDACESLMRNVRVAAPPDTSSWFCPRGFCTHARLTILSILLFALTGLPVVAQPNTKNVVVLFSFFERDHTSLDLMESSLRARVPWHVKFSVAYLENPRFEEKSYRESLAETFRRGYGREKPDLVIVASEPALRFAVEYRDKMFPGAPIVFFAISSALADQKMPGVTGVASPPGTRGTIDLALHLHPDTKAVAVITNVSKIERDWLAAVHSELLRHQDKVREIDLVGPPSGQMLERVHALPPHTVVLFQLFPQDSTQPTIGSWDVLAATARRLPTYSIFPTLALDRGGIGGAYYDGPKDCALAGEVAARVLSGEQPDNIPVVRNSNLQVRVDWRQLQRWHIPESALPPGSVVEFKRASPWQQYKWKIVGMLGLLALESLLIVALLASLRRRRRAEESLKGLTGQLLQSQDEERRRMARDLHDGTAQDLAGISLCLGQVLGPSAPDGNGTRHLLEEAHSLSRKALQEVRSVSYALHPPMVDQMGLVPALRWYLEGLMKRTNFSIILDAPPEIGALPPEVEGTLFRIVQESMSNIMRHSGADTVKVRLVRDSKAVRINIEDNGHGLEAHALSSLETGAPLGVGVAGMGERVRQVGGKLEIRSGGTGTTVLVSVPAS